MLERNKKKKIQMQRKQQSEVWPQGRTGREGSVAWKELRKWTWKLRAQELPFGAQDTVLVLVNEQTHMGETHTVCTQNTSLLHLKGMLGSGALSGLIAWAWNGTAAVWEAVSIYYKPVCSPGCTSTGSTGRIRPFREGMSCCSAGATNVTASSACYPRKAEALVSMIFHASCLCYQLPLFQMENVHGRMG